MPADPLIPDPAATTTHALSLRVGPSRAWPWLAQMGAGRAGWYAFDTLVNGGRPSAELLLPALLKVRQGALLPVVPGATYAFIASAVHPDRSLVLTVPGPAGGPRMTWEFLLERRTGARCRLVARMRVAPGWRAPPDPEQGTGRTDGARSLVERAVRVLRRAPPPVALALTALALRIFQAQVLRGIKRRAERVVARDPASARPRWVERFFPAAAVAERRSTSRASSGAALRG